MNWGFVPGNFGATRRVVPWAQRGTMNKYSPNFLPPNFRPKSGRAAFKARWLEEHRPGLLRRAQQRFQRMMKIDQERAPKG